MAVIRNPLIGALNLADPTQPWPDVLDHDGIGRLNEITDDYLGSLAEWAEQQHAEALRDPHSPASCLNKTARLETVNWILRASGHIRKAMGKVFPPLPTSEKERCVARSLRAWHGDCRGQGLLHE